MIQYLRTDINEKQDIEYILQGDQLNMTMFFGTLGKVTCPVYTYSGLHWTVGMSLYTRYQKNPAILNWSPCIGRYLLLFCTLDDEDHPDDGAQQLDHLQGQDAFNH